MEAIELLTLSTLARRVGLTDPTARRYHKRGILKPDFTASGALLFDPARVGELRDAITIHREPTAQL